mmetsp:Transcript_104468/g.207516  ORF Transcript_104468/g.207516 Transcript_104468/m.207516 type:complete len:559 (+) Transcript_104468:111-1787(+)
MFHSATWATDDDTISLLNGDVGAEVLNERESIPWRLKYGLRAYIALFVSLLAAGGLILTQTWIRVQPGNIADADRLVSQPASPTPCVGCRQTVDHRIKSRSSGRCLDWGNLIIANLFCDPAKKSQLWSYETQRIQIPDGRCLDDGGSTVHIWQCKNDGQVARNQHWTYHPNTGQVSQLGKMQLCLQESPVNTTVFMKPCDPTNLHQRWNVKSAESRPIILPVQPGQVRLKVGNCLDFGGSVHTWNCSTENANQEWAYDAKTLHIQGHNGKCLNSQNIKYLQRCEVSSQDQMWLLDKDTGQIRTYTGNCLQAQDLTAAGSWVFLQDCDPSIAQQQWVIEGLTMSPVTVMARSQTPVAYIVLAGAGVLGFISCVSLAVLLVMHRRQNHSRGIPRFCKMEEDLSEEAFDVETRQQAERNLSRSSEGRSQQFDVRQVQDQKHTEQNGKRPQRGISFEDVSESIPPEDDKLAEVALLKEEIPVKKSAPPTLKPQPPSTQQALGPVATHSWNAASAITERDDTTDSGHSMLGKCKTAGCGKPTWNGAATGYCYERGPYGRSSLS